MPARRVRNDRVDRVLSTWRVSKMAERPGMRFLGAPATPASTPDNPRNARARLHRSRVLDDRRPDDWR